MDGIGVPVDKLDTSRVTLDFVRRKKPRCAIMYDLHSPGGVDDGCPDDRLVGSRKWNNEKTNSFGSVGG